MDDIQPLDPDLDAVAHDASTANGAGEDVAGDDVSEVADWLPFMPQAVDVPTDAANPERSEPEFADTLAVSVVDTPADSALEPQSLRVTGPVIVDTPTPAADIVPLYDVGAPQRLGGRRFLQGVFLGALVGALVAASLVLVLRDGSTTASVDTFDVGLVLEIIEPAVVKVEVLSSTQGAGAGTGFVISPDGDIVTNAHVVEDATEIIVFLSDGTEMPARLLGADPTRDLAVIKIDASGLTVANLGTSSSIEVGDPVLAIGNALDLAGGPTVTTGIVSARNRVVPTESTRLTNVLQTDAAINPGNSGGPLVNANGEVIGISTAIAGNAEGIGFAIEIDHARPVIDSLAEGIVPSRPLLGVSVIDVEDIAEGDVAQYDIQQPVGAVVSRLSEGEAAATAGIEVGDVIVEFNGHIIESSSDLVAAVRASDIGDENQVVFFRGSDRKVVFVTLGELAGAGG